MPHSRAKIRSALLIVAILLATMTAGGVLQVRAQTTPPVPDNGDVDLSLGGTRAPWDVVADPETPPVGQWSAAAASDCLEDPAVTRRVRYTTDGVIHAEGCGQVFTMADIYNELPAVIRVNSTTNETRPKGEVLQQISTNVWLLKVDLLIEEGATLNVIGGSGPANVNELRLFSATNTSSPPNTDFLNELGISLRTDNGNIKFQDTTVTSWDPAINGPDLDYSLDDPATPANEGAGAGRSYIAARSVVDSTRFPGTVAPAACTFNGTRYDGGPTQQGGAQQQFYEARMDVLSSTVTELGYYGSEAYGLVWKAYYKSSGVSDPPPANRALYNTVDVFGDVTGSTLQHNYFGTYTFGAYCMNFLGNNYNHNIKYGLDPHDDSDYLNINDNDFQFNGSHGVICSQFCNNLRITHNRSHDNIGVANLDETTAPYTHGIMLHRSVSNSLVEDNDVYNNNGGGIAVFESYSNVIRNNRVSDNGQAGLRLSVGSHDNLFENNTVTGLASANPALNGPGYVLYTYKGSDTPAVTDGYVRNNTFRNNTFTGNKTPTMRLQEGQSNIFEGNTIAGPGVTFDLERTSINNVISVTNTKLGTLIFDMDATSSAILDVSGLAPRACLRATANNNEIGRGYSDSLGHFTVTFAGPTSSPSTVAITTAAGCGSRLHLPSVSKH